MLTKNQVFKELKDLGIPEEDIENCVHEECLRASLAGTIDRVLRGGKRKQAHVILAQMEPDTFERTWQREFGDLPSGAYWII
ncbi:MAG: hypothetical protein HPY45_09945 [Anaerolineae bacterium]|nr:hypothetical protein [Anaerolineae bacterium]